MRFFKGLTAAMLALSAAILTASPAFSEGYETVPARAAGEGRGPYPTLVIRGATLVDGTGAPPLGPVDITIKGNRIAAIDAAGTPGIPLKPDREPKGAVREIDGTGMTVLPGFVDVARAAGLARLMFEIDPKTPSRSSSTPAFVDAVSPRLALVSAGWRNRFRQPAAEVLERYRERGATVRCTDLEGALRVKLPAGAAKAVTARALVERPRYWSERTPG